MNANKSQAGKPAPLWQNPPTWRRHSCLRFGPRSVALLTVAVFAGGCGCVISPTPTGQLDQIRSELVSAAAATQDRGTRDQIALTVEHLDSVRNTEQTVTRRTSQKGGLASYVLG